MARLSSLSALRSWICVSCRSVAAEIGSLRESAPRDRVDALERELACAAAGDRKCPRCTVVMQRAAVAVGGGSIEIDGCNGCRLAWFDRGELRSLRDIENRAHMRRRPVPVFDPRTRIERLRADGIAVEDDVTAAVLGIFLGIPYPEPIQSWEGRPILTWALCALLVCTTLAAFASGFDAYVGRFGMVPAELAKGGWITLITHVFLHADLFHLAGNVFFLFLFGARLEALIGRVGYVILVAVASAAGALTHAAFAPDPQIALIGASGAISGVIAAHACLRPRAKIRMMRYFRMVTVPATVAFSLWIALQLIGTGMQFAGASPVSALAHLGGAAAGFVAALPFKPRARRVDPVCA